ncbi:hypothetical protein [Halorhabdus rudnickae]|uniref:hypothetical protein n=1 Tax=Halorhabdus rudnickae TaxID=1775544 RepID=UPI00108285B8|nr:hypothetical protein [Halorhabdus rudnickae]
MNVGRAVGVALLALVDATAAGLLAGFATLWLVPFLWASDAVLVATIVFGVVTGTVLAIALTLAHRGEQPFPATRLALGVLDRLPRWWP